MKKPQASTWRSLRTTLPECRQLSSPPPSHATSRPRRSDHPVVCISVTAKRRRHRPARRLLGLKVANSRRETLPCILGVHRGKPARQRRQRDTIRWYSSAYGHGDGTYHRATFRHTEFLDFIRMPREDHEAYGGGFSRPIHGAAEEDSGLVGAFAYEETLCHRVPPPGRRRERALGSLRVTIQQRERLRAEPLASTKGPATRSTRPTPPRL
ncbi:hypothetical protein Q5P01_000090 [Channa striata]|uniref:Uncharacterized protein n=1 Tax=Channa striata TaxID=64152 RepID=A0AA88IY70_CHASR|nr:hypothetical protein Q5P01_000090 [Channa striata]